MKIFGWLADHAGCGWYRVVLPLGALRALGVNALWDARMPESAWDADIIIAQRTCNPGPTSTYQRIAKHSGPRPKLVYELDDDLWSVDRANRLAAGFFDDPTVRKNLTDNVTMADLVTVSTEPLAEVVRQWNPNVAVLPNAVSLEMTEWRHGMFQDRLTIGWQGSPTHDGDWRTAANPVERWFNTAKKNGTRLEMHTIGAVPKSFPSIYPHRHTAWSDSMTQYYRTVDWDVALAPLAPTKFNRSKSNLRVLEAGMLGIPTVASDVAAYRDSVVDGKTGFLVREPKDWGRALSALLDPDLRAEMGAAARVWATAHTIEQRVGLWLEAYSGLLA